MVRETKLCVLFFLLLFLHCLDFWEFPLVKKQKKRHESILFALVETMLFSCDFFFLPLSHLLLLTATNYWSLAKKLFFCIILKTKKKKSWSFSSRICFNFSNRSQCVIFLLQSVIYCTFLQIIEVFHYFSHLLFFFCSKCKKKNSQCHHHRNWNQFSNLSSMKNLFNDFVMPRKKEQEEEEKSSEKHKFAFWSETLFNPQSWFFFALFLYKNVFILCFFYAILNLK